MSTLSVQRVCSLYSTMILKALRNGGFVMLNLPVHGPPNPGRCTTLDVCMPCRAPRLTGTTLQFVVWLLESAFSGPIWVKSMRDSGIPQAVRDIDLPEPATYKPYWLQRSSTTSKEEVVVEDKPVQERLELASQAIPGAAPAARSAAPVTSPRCWQLPLHRRVHAADLEPLWANKVCIKIRETPLSLQASLCRLCNPAERAAVR